MPDVLSEEVVRASWEAERDSIRAFLLIERKFNPKYVEKAVTNFIESMAFARIPCGTGAGIATSWRQFKREEVGD